MQYAVAIPHGSLYLLFLTHKMYVVSFIKLHSTYTGIIIPKQHQKVLSVKVKFLTTVFTDTMAGQHLLSRFSLLLFCLGNTQASDVVIETQYGELKGNQKIIDGLMLLLYYIIIFYNYFILFSFE